MKEHRWWRSTVSSKGLVYSIGGYDHKKTKMKTAECVYDPTLDKWPKIASIECARVHYGPCAFNDYAYVIGGARNSTGHT